MSRVPLFNQAPTEAITWVYPLEGAVLYEASTFVLGSTIKATESLCLNGQDLPLTFGEEEKSFAHVIPLAEGENLLELRTNTGESITRQVIRQIPWRFSEEAKVPLFPILPNPQHPPRYLLGQSFPVELRAMTHVQEVWLSLVDEAGKVIREIPLRCDDAFQLNPKNPTHGHQTSIFGKLHYNETHPPVDKRIKLFQGRVDLTHPLLQYLPDSHHLRLQYKVLDDEKQVSFVNLGQVITLWQFQRTVEVTASCRAFYAGASEGTERLTIMPPLHSLMPVVGLLQVDEFLIQHGTNTPYLLKGGKPHPQAGKRNPACLEAISVEETEASLKTLCRFTHPCGVVLTPDPEALSIRMDPVDLGLNHQHYQNRQNFRWQVSRESDSANLRLPLSWKEFKGVASHWTQEGLEVKLLKLPAQKKDWRILLDAGHGGDEHGTHALNGTPEKTWTLELAQRIKLLLHEAGCEHVFMTRDDDVNLSLLERQQKADDLEVDLCLSLHANARPDGEDPHSRQGVSIHTYTPWSQDLGDALLESLASVQVNDGRYFSNYAMTRLPRCVSVLIEYGYFIHPQDYVNLLDDEHLWGVAHATVAGIVF